MIELNKIYNKDCLIGMQDISDGSVDVILTDPPYLYLKNQKLDRPFDEAAFFNEIKRVLKKDGFIVLFGRGTSFYRWNTILNGLGFKFKEEFVWDKCYCTSPLMAISRVHETISVFTKGKGTINKVKVPYLEMKGHDIDAICVDLKRFLSGVKNIKSLEAVLDFIENNKVPIISDNVILTSISSIIGTQDRSASVISGIKNGMNEKSIIRTDYAKTNRPNNVSCEATKPTGDRGVNVLNSIVFGVNNKSIIRADRYETDKFTKHRVNADKRKSGDRSGNVIQSICY